LHSFVLTFQNKLKKYEILLKSKVVRISSHKNHFLENIYIIANKHISLSYLTLKLLSKSIMVASVAGM